MSDVTIPDVNDIFADFAALFTGQQTGPEELAHPERLERTALDGSLDSLRAVDAYLLFLHQTRPEDIEDSWATAMLWGGAYVGEVIRRHARRNFNWIDYDDFLLAYPATVEILGAVKRLGWAAVLSPGGGGFTLPINKLLRFLFDGPEDSVYLYALHEVAPPATV